MCQGLSPRRSVANFWTWFLSLTNGLWRQMITQTHQLQIWERNLSMLILSRKESECIHLGDEIVVTIVRVNGDKVRIGVQAPPHVKILRTEQIGRAHV